MQNTSWETLGWRKHKLESRLLGEISVTSDMQMTPQICRKWRRTKELLDKMKEESGKNGLKLKFRKLRSLHPVPSLNGNRWGNSGWLYFGGLQNHCRWWLQPWSLKTLAPWKKNYDQLRQHIKKQRHYFANKGPSRWSYVVSSGHVWMWELDYKESWAPKNWCFWTVVLEDFPGGPVI